MASDIAHGPPFSNYMETALSLTDDELLKVGLLTIFLPTNLLEAAANDSLLHPCFLSYNISFA